MPYAPVFESLNRNKTLLSLCDYHLSEGLPCNPVYDAGSLALNIFLAQRHAWPRCGWQVHILSWAQPSGLHLCLQLSQYVSCRSFSAVCKVSFVNPACLMPPGYHVRGECRTQSTFVCKWAERRPGRCVSVRAAVSPLPLSTYCLIICRQNVDERRCQTSTGVPFHRHVPIRFLLHIGDCYLPNSNFGGCRDGSVSKVFAV